jgi:hypothetical protein
MKRFALMLFVSAAIIACDNGNISPAKSKADSTVKAIDSTVKNIGDSLKADVDSVAKKGDSTIKAAATKIKEKAKGAVKK